MLNINRKKNNQSYDFSTTSEKNDGIFYIGNEKIYIVQNYTYLGTQISSTGNLSLEHNT